MLFPFFIAAYHFLSHLSALNGVSMGPISDLGAPDALLTIAGITINAVATGGLGRYVTPVCRHKLIYDESLLIKGLDLLYKMNS